MLNPNSRGLPRSDRESLAVRFTSSANVTSADTGQPAQLGLGGGQSLPAGVKQVPLTAIGHPLKPRRALATRFSEHRIDYTVLNTAEPLDRALFSYLSSRERLMRVR